MLKYGIIGDPVGHSLSPLMHNAAFKARGIDAEYIKIPVKPNELEDFLLNRKNIKGFNITVPYKIKAREILKEKFHVVKTLPYPHYDKMSGAINTVKRNGEDIEYCNTDPIGFDHSLEEDLKFGKTTGKSVLVIGCGGASRAIVAELSDPGHYIKKIYLYDINKEAVDSTKRHLSKVFPDWNIKIEFIDDEKKIPEKIEGCQLLVNTSPVGMKDKDDVSVVDESILALNKKLYVYDVVYTRETGLIKTAKGLGMRAVGGRGMLAYQGAFSFSLWTGVAAKDVVGVMRKKLDEVLDTKI